MVTHLIPGICILYWHAPLSWLHFENVWQNVLVISFFVTIYYQAQGFFIDNIWLLECMKGQRIISESELRLTLYSTFNLYL